MADQGYGRIEAGCRRAGPQNSGEFTQQSAQYVEAARKHYDAAEKLNIPDYQEKEDAFMQLVPPAVGADIMRLFPEKSAALMYHLGANPEKTRQLLAMDGQLR